VRKGLSIATVVNRGNPGYHGISMGVGHTRVDAFDSAAVEVQWPVVAMG